MKKNLILIAAIIACALSSFGQTTVITKPPIVVKTILANWDTARKTTDTTITTTIAVSIKYDTLKYRVPVAPAYKRPKYKVYPASTFNYQNGLAISLDSINSNLGNVRQLVFNNCNNLHITKCYFTNTTGFAITLNNCTNVLIDSCVFVKVAFGVFANGGNHIRVNHNQGLNRYDPTGLNGRFSHWVQFQNVNGGGSQVNYNIFEDVAGVALHPHDGINLYQCNGLQGDSIQVIGNWLRGGQQVFWPTAYSGAAGIILGDVGGSYQVARGNILVNTGASGIQSPSTASGIKIDHNQLYSAYSAVSHQAITILNPIRIECSYNRTNWTNYNYINAVLSDGETQYYLGSSPVPTPVGFSTNLWKASISAAILPAVIITWK